MQKESLINNQIFHLVTLTIVAGFLRLFRLDQMPPGITNDELVYVYNAYSIFKTGKNIFGEFLPIITYVAGYPFLPVNILVGAPFVGLLGLSLWSSRLPFAILGVLDIILLYFLTFTLLRSRSIAFLASFLLAISPWHIQVTRTAFDAPVALFFYLLGITLFLILIKAKRSFIWAIFPFWLAMFSYRATNVIFIPIIVLLFWYACPNIKTSPRNFFLFLIGVGLILTSVFLVSRARNDQSYTKEIYLLNLDSLTESVTREIRYSEAPLIIRRIFSNKPLYALRIFRENYLGAFSPEFLFTSGEASGIYSLWFRGMFYIIELPLLILGLIFLFKKYKKELAFIGGSILIAPLPSALVVEKSYVMRSIYMLPFLTMVIATGIIYFLSFLKRIDNQPIRKILLGVFFTWYFFLFLSYFYQYHFRYPVYGGESWFKSSRILAEKLMDYGKTKNKIIVANASPFEFLQYAFYSRLDPNIASKLYKSELPITIGLITFQNLCLNRGKGDPHKILAPNTIYITRETCHQEILADEFITDPQKERIIWKIYINE